ncbi:response regulator [Xanthobacter sp. AM11]|uniref:response regulator transcription factor n=1 Tax=Xanthobacter sp. AM11 TaxID=3380643 RepID=UPI0039BFB8A4
MLPSLLLVEDDPIEARRLESALSAMGYRVTLAPDGDAALALLGAEPFDVMLLDLVVPGLDGMGVLRAMAQKAYAVPVVVQVTPAGMDAAGGAIRAGARDFVVKPAGALRLEVALRNAAILGRAEPARPEPHGAPAPDNVIRLTPPAPRAAAPQMEPEPADLPEVPAAAYARLDAAGHARRLEQIEAEAIRFALSLYGGRLAEVARRLGIGRSTLYRKLADLQMEADGAAHAQAVEGNHTMEPERIQFVAAE